jgi:L-iditol 2-dehydrogenase
LDRKRRNKEEKRGFKCGKSYVNYLRQHSWLKMKAVMYYSLEDIRIEDVAKPQVGFDEVLVEMKACGVCGSDLMDWYVRSRAPLVLGHEPAGVIVEAGKNVKGFNLGDRVFAHHHVADLTCYFCVNGDYTMCPQFGQTHLEPGGFTEYFKVPALNLQTDTLKLPNTLSYEEATLIEPVGCCIRAQNKVGIRRGDNVAIIGAGPNGIIHAMLARFSGANQIVVTDIVDYRLKMAKHFGADLVVNPQREDIVRRVEEVTENRGVDIVIVTAPNVEAVEDGVQILRRGGRLLLFAPTPPDQYARLDPHRLFFSEITVIPSYSVSHIETRSALQLISSGRVKVKDLITHRFPLSRAADAFQTAARSKECMKVVVLNEA